MLIVRIILEFKPVLLELRLRLVNFQTETCTRTSTTTCNRVSQEIQTIQTITHIIGTYSLRHFSITHTLHNHTIITNSGACYYDVNTFQCTYKCENFDNFVGGDDLVNICDEFPGCSWFAEDGGDGTLTSGLYESHTTKT